MTVVVALGKRDGLPLDVWLRHGLALLRVPKLQTPGRTRAGQPLPTLVGGLAAASLVAALGVSGAVGGPPKRHAFGMVTYEAGVMKGVRPMTA